MKKCLFLLFAVPILCTAQTRDIHPESTVPSVWPEDSLFQQQLPVNDVWWKVFHDTTLDSLIQVAVVQNNSAIKAIHQMDMARLNWRMQQGKFFPTLSLNGGWNRQKSSGNSTGQPEAWVGYWDAAVSMNWEVDVFGSIRLRAKAQKENFVASQEEYNATMISLCAQVAIAYFNLRQYQQELEVLQHNSASQKQVVDITQVRYQTGLASKLDVAQAKSVYYSTLASIPSVEAGIIQSVNSLAVLIGVYPDDIRAMLSTPKPLPDYVEAVGIGLPANLLRRRPDIRGAERVIRAQAATLGASRADLLPKFSLNGSIGYAAHETRDLTKRKSMTWQLAPSMTWTFFSGGQLYNANRLARIQLDEAINQYNQTVLTAVQEVDDAMAAYSNSIKQAVALREVIYQGRETLKLSLDLYKQGLSPFQNVLDAQRSLLSFENSMVQAKGYSLICLIKMYQALGGGWNDFSGGL